MAVSLITGGASKANKRSITDYYPTPTATTQALLNEQPFENINTILEPACGLCHISNVVKKEYPYANIKSSDLHFYGDNSIETGVDFLTEKYDTKFDLVITNPPYSRDILMPFVSKTLEVSNRYVAMFLKITFLESISRKDFFDNNKTLKTVYIFSNRQPIYKNGEVTGASNAICYAWFLWDKQYNGNPEIKLLNNSKLIKSNKANGIY